MSDLVPRGQLTSQGVKGVGAIVGGGTLLVLAAISHGLLGIIFGGAIAVVGLALSGSKTDRKAGIVALTAGAVAVGVSLIPGLRWLIWLPGLGLLAAGILSLFRFAKSLRKRM